MKIRILCALMAMTGQLAFADMKAECANLRSELQNAKALLQEAIRQGNEEAAEMFRGMIQDLSSQYNSQCVHEA